MKCVAAGNRFADAVSNAPKGVHLRPFPLSHSNSPPPPPSLSLRPAPPAFTTSSALPRPSSLLPCQLWHAHRLYPHFWTRASSRVFARACGDTRSLSLDRPTR
eukprot:2773530-Pleurochrysis_carterae.AAC.2